ncbi:aconitate hydratase [Trifolium repens]|nr:aconitate hydratase [Trifolium repens]WJX95361.1 aconitate hydratase [Trifolium repens]
MLELFLLLGTDSHTISAGVFGQFPTGVGNTDATFILELLHFIKKIEVSFLLAVILVSHGKPRLLLKSTKARSADLRVHFKELLENMTEMLALVWKMTKGCLG